MNDGPEREGWFAELEPPPGGLAALRRRLARRVRRRRVVLRGSLAGASAAAALIAGVLLWNVSLDGGAPGGPGRPAALARGALAAGDDLLAIGLGLAEAPTEPATVAPAQRGRAALLRVPTRDERVVLYLVGTLPGG